MPSITLKTNINCQNCVAKVSPFFDEQKGIESWQVDTQNPDKILLVKGQITEKQVITLVQKAGFQVKENNTIPEKNTFWNDEMIWKKAALNTTNCLIGCSIGDFAMIIYLQSNHHHLPMWITMSLAIVAGLCSSILLETAILHYKEKFNWTQALQTALGMSLISMVAMEIAMNITDFMITGGQADFHSHTYWLAFGVAMIAGFFAPLPYNYFKLKKYNKACH